VFSLTFFNNLQEEYQKRHGIFHR